MMDIRGQILEQLNQIEREHHVRIPIACCGKTPTSFCR